MMVQSVKSQCRVVKSSFLAQGWRGNSWGIAPLIRMHLRVVLTLGPVRPADVLTTKCRRSSQMVEACGANHFTLGFLMDKYQSMVKGCTFCKLWLWTTWNWGLACRGKMGNVRFLWSKLSLLIPQKTSWVGLSIEYIGDPMFFPKIHWFTNLSKQYWLKLPFGGIQNVHPFVDKPHFKNIQQPLRCFHKAVSISWNLLAHHQRPLKEQGAADSKIRSCERTRIQAIQAYRHIVIVGHYTMQILNPSHFNLPGSKSIYIIFPQSSPRNPQFHGMFSHVCGPTLAIFSHETLEDLEVSTL